MTIDREDLIGAWRLHDNVIVEFGGAIQRVASQK